MAIFSCVCLDFTIEQNNGGGRGPASVLCCYFFGFYVSCSSLLSLLSWHLSCPLLACLFLVYIFFCELSISMFLISFKLFSNIISISSDRCFSFISLLLESYRRPCGVLFLSFFFLSLSLVFLSSL